MKTSFPASRLASLLLVAFAATGCMSLEYDLASVQVPVSARPASVEAPGAASVEPFTIERSRVLWVHGLFGRSVPDVGEMLASELDGCDRVTGFRVSQRSNVHQWLLTHLTLSLVRMRTVVVEGQRVRDPG